MGITTGSNIVSLSAQRRLAESTSALSSTLERLSSGMRINSASDDAAGIAIANSLNADSRVFSQAVRNISDGISYLSIAESALQELSSITSRQQELAQQAANGSYSLQQRRALDAEANALVSEFNRIVAGTQFNGISLLDRSRTELSIQAGYGAGGGISFGITDSLTRRTGTGTFGAVTTIGGTIPMVVSGEVSDLNGDGNLDMVYSVFNGSIFFRAGNGDGTFKAAVTASGAGGTVNAIELYDVNGDGKPDMITAGSTGGTGAVNVLLGNGNGTFLAGVSYTLGGTSTSQISFADFNDDGVMDIITRVSSGTQSVSIMLGNSNGTFKAGVTVLDAPSFGEFSFVDTNNDGIKDLVASGAGGTVAVAIGNGNGTFKAIVNYQAHNSVTGATTVGDVNRDGIVDIISIGDNSPSGLSVLLGNGDGSFYKSASYSLSNVNPTSVNLRDFNGDGIPDIISTSELYTNGIINVRLGNGDGTFGANSTYLAGLSANDIRFHDLNKDGALDIVVFGSNGPVPVSGGGISVIMGVGQKVTSAEHLNITTAGGALQAIGILESNRQRISSELGSIGAARGRLEIALNHTMNSRDNFTAAAGRITDADTATEAANLLRAQILQQTTSAVLAQANQQPALVLKLLR